MRLVEKAMPADAGCRDHRFRQYRKCGGAPQGWRVRLSGQTGGAGSAAFAGQSALELPDRAEAVTTQQLIGDSGGHRCGARDDRQAGAQPGAGFHFRRIRQRQGAGSTADACAKRGRRRPLSRSTAARFRRPLSKASSSATAGGRSPAPMPIATVFPGRKWRHPVSRRGCRPAAADAGQAAARDSGKTRAQRLAVPPRNRSTCASSRRPIAIFANASRPAASARISITGWT